MQSFQTSVPELVTIISIALPVVLSCSGFLQTFSHSQNVLQFLSYSCRNPQHLNMIFHLSLALSAHLYKISYHQFMSLFQHSCNHFKRQFLNLSHYFHFSPCCVELLRFFLFVFFFFFFSKFSHSKKQHSHRHSHTHSHRHSHRQSHTHHTSNHTSNHTEVPQSIKQKWTDKGLST